MNIDLRSLAEYDQAIENITKVMTMSLVEEGGSSAASGAEVAPPPPTYEAATARKRQAGDAMPAPPTYPPSLTAEDMDVVKEFGLDKNAVESLARLAEVSRIELDKLLRKLPNKGAAIGNPSAFVKIGVQSAIVKVTERTV